MSSAAAGRLLDETMKLPFRGWDFSVLGERIRVEPPPWNFERLVDKAAAGAASMLDMGTGGGEWLSQRRRAPRTAATEGWPPNAPVAWARLAPLGVPVVQDEGALDNVDQSTGAARGRLPFRDGAFDLVVNRHEAFVAGEVRRVLRPDSVFITQQASSGTFQFHRLLGLEAPRDREFHLALAVEQLVAGGLRIEESAVGQAKTFFADVGALAWYLTHVPWAVPGFTIGRHRDALVALHGHAIAVPSERFWLRALA